ncbi:MAG: ATP-binding protein [Lutimonas sp.]
MKTLLNFFLVIFMPWIACAQYEDDYVNSLKTELENAKNDTIKLEINRLLGFYFQDSNADIALEYHLKQLELAKNLNLKLWEADAHQQVAYCYRWLDNLPASYESYMNALKIAEDPSSSGNGYGYANFSFSKNPEDARKSIIGMIHYEMASLYARTRLNDEIRSHLFQALKMGEDLQNQKILSLTSRDLGTYYFTNDQPDSAFSYYQKALKHYKGSPYQIQSGVVYGQLSKYYLAEQKFDSAITYGKKAMSMANSEIKLGALTDAQLLMGQIFLQTKQLDSAIFYTQRAINTAKSTNAAILIGLGNVQLASIYKEQNEDSLAYIHLDRGKTLLDSINELYITRLLQFQNIDFDQKIRLSELEKESELTKSRIRMYGLLAGLGIFVLVALLLYRNNRLKQKANSVLKTTLDDLKTTQAQLIQSEKMASLGELTAGIAHEIQNPLNFVNNFSEVSNELIDEMYLEIEKANLEEVKFIAKDLKQNLEKINHHGKRADTIVKGMLQHSRSSSGQKETTDINELCDEYFRLAYHGLRAKDKSFNANMDSNLDPDLPKIKVVAQDIGRVILNLITNAFYVVNERKKKEGEGYKPTVSVSTQKVGNTIQIRITDNGSGIPDSIKEKIFQPFFTTKPTGSGTGLGLSLSYDIVKAHGGELKVESKEGEGSSFIISLPIIQ